MQESKEVRTEAIRRAIFETEIALSSASQVHGSVSRMLKRWSWWR